MNLQECRQEIDILKRKLNVLELAEKTFNENETDKDEDEENLIECLKDFYIKLDQTCTLLHDEKELYKAMFNLGVLCCYLKNMIEKYE